jgi:general L-amino acid transport system permease protein
MTGTNRGLSALLRGRWQLAWWLLLGWLVWHVVDWAVLQAVFGPDLAACQALRHQGACWGVVQVKGMAWLFGRYPEHQLWRPALAMALWLASTAWLLRPLLQGREARPWLGQVMALACWPAGMWLMGGNGLGLPVVESAQWGGLPLTLMLTACTLLLSAPLAWGLALARQTGPRWLSLPATALIEVARGGPLVMWLFGAAFVLPAILPADWHWGPIARVLVVTTVFSAAYAAEILRGSLATVLRDQSEAAGVLGATWWQTQSRVVVPQVWRGALPALTGHTIGVLKDTALVTIVSLQDLTGAMSVSLNGDADWRPFFLEAYLVIAAIYALMCLGVAYLGKQLELRACRAG